MLNKTLAIATALLIGGLSNAALGSDKDYVRVDKCEGYEDFVALCSPQADKVMPEFCPMSDSMSPPGPMPNGAVVLPREAKCWVWAQLTLIQYYPAIAEKIADDLLIEQQKIHDKQLAAATKFNWTLPAVVGGAGIFGGMFFMFLIIK